MVFFVVIFIFFAHFFSSHTTTTYFLTKLQTNITFFLENFFRIFFCWFGINLNKRFTVFIWWNHIYFCKIGGFDKICRFLPFFTVVFFNPPKSVEKNTFTLHKHVKTIIFINFNSTKKIWKNFSQKKLCYFEIRCRVLMGHPVQNRLARVVMQSWNLKLLYLISTKSYVLKFTTW